MEMDTATYIAGVIVRNTFVNIVTIWMVDDDTFGWVSRDDEKETIAMILFFGERSIDFLLFVVGNIIIHHHDNVRIGNAILV